MAVPAQLLQLLAPGPDRVDLILVVVAQGLEDAVEPGVLLGDELLEARQRGALGLQPLAAGGRRGPLLGVTLQAALHLGLALAEHPPALGDARHADLERLAPSRAPRPAAPRATARR